MPQGTLKFELPEEQDEFQMAIDATSTASRIEDFHQYLKSMEDHKIKLSQFLYKKPMDEKAKKELLKAAKKLAEKTKPKKTFHKEKPTWERDAEADFKFVVDAYEQRIRKES